VVLTPDIRGAVIAKTLRVPMIDGDRGDGAAVARQLDVALVSAGFKCSRELLEHLSQAHPAVAQEAARSALRAVRELIGDHVEHNVYFVDFPANVPDTIQFWNRCIADALLDQRSSANVLSQLRAGFVNLLDLPKYGRYQHTYEEMLAAHEPLNESAKDRVTLLHLGHSLAEESHALYLSLATTPVPLQEDDLALLRALAEIHISDSHPEAVDVRENRAMINAARVANGLAPWVDTPVDVLRLACALSEGDVTLSEPTRLRSLRRAERRALIAALNEVVGENPAKLADVARYGERFKRLGERLHPHEHPLCPAAQDVFTVARGERTVRSLAGRVEIALADGDPDAAVAALERAPGMLMRSVDRLARAGADVDGLANAVRVAAPATSTRVLLSLREHLLNRGEPSAARIFVNQQGRSWVAPDERAPLSGSFTSALAEALDAEIAGRLPRIDRLVVEPAARALAIPLTEKTRPQGLGILPRGSVQPLAQHARFFVYWKERAHRTDLDLSVLLLDDDFQFADQVSWTNLKRLGATHSGDITEAPAGASEFIDLDLGRVEATYVVPQVNKYSGEGFDELEEVFFGFMERAPEQKGRPFEARTVRAKSDLFGAGRVALPVIFARDPEHGWRATWMHLNLPGHPNFNRVEHNYRGTSLLVRGIVERKYLRLSYLEDLMRGRGTVVLDAAPDGQPVTYLGLDHPDGTPDGSTVYTPANLTQLLNPA
jgi:stress response protein SCP2